MNTGIAPQVTTWKMDPAHSAAEFKVKHMMISNVKGRFSGVQGSLVLDETDIANSRVEASIDAASVSTQEPQRDAHLKSADFLDVEKFPALTFKSGRVVRSGDGELQVTGNLTVHGVTRTVLFHVEGPSAPVKDPYGNTRRGFSAAAKISRKDFGLSWNAVLETGGIMVGDDVTITLEAEFIKS